ncbi:hypothetical protein XENTR_v10009179 [Xenopus tropicalis]|nr:hypothetical protein XENTR_v10009179 [Xenopus tropicalis]
MTSNQREQSAARITRWALRANVTNSYLYAPTLQYPKTHYLKLWYYGDPQYLGILIVLNIEYTLPQRYIKVHCITKSTLKRCFQLYHFSSTVPWVVPYE